VKISVKVENAVSCALQMREQPGKCIVKKNMALIVLAVVSSVASASPRTLMESEQTSFEGYEIGAVTFIPIFHTIVALITTHIRLQDGKVQTTHEA